MENESRERPFTAGQRQEDSREYDDDDDDGEYVADTNGRRVLFWIACGLVVLVVVMAIFLFGQRKEIPLGPDLSGITDRIVKLETRAGELEAAVKNQEARLAYAERSLETAISQQARLVEKTDRLAGDAAAASYKEKSLAAEPAAPPAEEPPPAAEPPARPEKKSAKETDPAKTHTVKPGETLYSISKKYKVDLEELKKLNNIKENQISLGQDLRLP